jgi:hypothetical protein
MAQPPDDRADDGLTAELQEQLEEGAEEAQRFAALLEHQRAVRQLVSAYQAGRAACPEGMGWWLRRWTGRMPGSGGHDPTGRSASPPCGPCLAATWNSFDPGARYARPYRRHRPCPGAPVVVTGPPRCVPLSRRQSKV